MTERDVYPPARTEKVASERPSWNAVELSTAVEHDAVDVRDVAHGDGLRFNLDPDAETSLEVFPDAAVARLEWPAGRLELYRQAPPVPQLHGLRFDQGDDNHQVAVSIAASGAVTFWLAPSQSSAERPETGDASPPELDLQYGDEAESLEYSGGSDVADSAPVHLDESAVIVDRPSPEQQEQPRVDLRGRVGRDPFVRRTPRGTLLARFPLAVQEEGQEKTIWHQILSFGERAARVQETVKQGQKVTVVGYPHQREVPQKDGSVKIVEEIYAVVVKSSKPNQTQADS